MKWVALGICLILILPLSTWLRNNPHQRLKFWMLLGFLPFVVDYYHLYMALDARPEWGGYVKGAEASALDLVALCLYISSPSVRGRLAFRYPMVFYFLATLFSAVQTLAPIESLFYSWQLARMFLVYATVSKGCADPRVTHALMKGMAAALIVQAVFAIWQRFGLGAAQTSGTLGHQNLLGVMSHLVVLPFFALLLAGPRGPWPAAVILAGVIVDISTASRATIELSGFGFAAIFVLSAIGKWTPRKARALLIGALAITVLVPAAMASLQERFGSVPLGSVPLVFDDTVGGYDERGAFKAAAVLMISDHPWGGVGANHFAVMGNVGGYFGKTTLSYWAAYGNVHNIYYLAAAETGYLGLIALLALLSAPLVVAFRCGWRNLEDDKGNLLLGFGVALLAVYLHSWEEWSLAIFPAQYLLAMTMGLVASNARQLGYWQRTRPQESGKFIASQSPNRKSPSSETANKQKWHENSDRAARSSSN